MPPIRSRPSRARSKTPPPDLFASASNAPNAPKSWCIPSNRARTRHNQADKGPDPRGRRRALTRSDTVAIADYLDDPTTSLDAKGAPWQDLANAAGVELPSTIHFKPPGKRTLNPQAIQLACRDDEDIINAVCEEEKLLDPRQAEERLDWTDIQLEVRPHSIDWEKVYFCDEFHFGLGPKVTKRIKRKKGPKYRYKPENVHRKKVTKKDTTTVAQAANPLKIFSVCVIIGPNYRRYIPYNTGNSNGKMNSRVYKQILSQLLDEFKRDGITLCQDVDSAHKSKETKAWIEEHNFPMITLPGVSPDFSILESMAHPIKKKFHAQKATESTALDRFKKVFEEEVDQETIKDLYQSFTNRLHSCRRAAGQMTKY
ncbi:hmg box protein [Rutstroemia sp. NJR-2017a WRK4]|nr:hmg box protein [Rutstroemia sp. NJR-2017a WRK4]